MTGISVYIRAVFIFMRRAPGRTHSRYRHFLRLVIVFAAYFGAAKVGLAVPFTSSNVSPVWPAAGVAVAAVLIWGVRIAPAIALAAFLVNFLSPIPRIASVAIGLGNASSAVLAGYFLTRFSDFQVSLGRLKDLLRLALFAAVLATTVAAFVGVSALTLAHAKAWSGYSSAWRLWWLGDAMGVLVIAPLLLTARDLLRVCKGWRAIEAGLLSIALLVTSVVAFGPRQTVRDNVLAFIVFPFLIWAAIRFRVAGAAAASVLSASVAVWGTAHGYGPFVNHTPLHNAVLLQMFVAVTTLTGLMLAAVINEREYMARAFESEKKLLSESEAAKEKLEERVKERTLEIEQNATQMAYQAKLLDLANDAIFVRGSQDEISYWNEGAERLYGWSKEEVLGRSIHDVLHTEFPVPLSQILHSERWEGELRHTTKAGTQITVASRWTTLRDSSGKSMGWLEINTDVTSRKRAEEAARSLSGRILTLQDNERRRIARELHDSLGQYLTALKMNLDALERSVPDKAKLASDCSAIVDKCLSETRTISYLLHPPLLDEAGLGFAARWYVDGFARRSKINVNLNVAPDLGRLPKDIEIALFRAIQETLTNVHRHSGASEVDIFLDLNEGELRLEVDDNGRGIAKTRLGHIVDGAPGAGVGLAGMRERVRELGGSLEIRSSGKGTTVTVTVPLNTSASNNSTGNREIDRASSVS